MFLRAPHPRFAALAWTTLFWNLLVIGWGAVVRATGSGAGCGSHWPLCNGEIVPFAPETATLIEFSHRLTSGIALLLVLWLAVRARRSFEFGHPVRKAVAFAVFFMLVEAGVGAGLVLLRLVEENSSAARAVYMSIHLANTLLLVAALALTASWASREWVQPLLDRERAGWLYWLSLLLLLATGVTGAIAALGDTLFPAQSLVDGLTLDFEPGAHFLLRLRILHPPMAWIAGFSLLFLARRAGAGGDRLRRLGRWMVFLVAFQLIAGMVNLVLLAPTWLQVAHLGLADLLWITAVLYGDALTEGPFLRHRSGLG